MSIVYVATRLPALSFGQPPPIDTNAVDALVLRALDDELAPVAAPRFDDLDVTESDPVEVERALDRARFSAMEVFDSYTAEAIDRYRRRLAILERHHRWDADPGWARMAAVVDEVISELDEGNRS